MSIFSEMLLRNVNTIIAFLVLIAIIGLGVTFDTIGIAVATANERPFHAMASKKIVSAKYSIALIKNASQVSNFCNDVIGDICGIVSGAAVAIIVTNILSNGGLSISTTVFSIALSGCVAALTVGGKAIGKELALNNSKGIVDYVGKIVFYFDDKLGISIIKL
ncbi:MAG: hypothetical protein WBA54_01230 [Acidaminobacteraceae bacterium]